jgi:hypothetical protein
MVDSVSYAKSREVPLQRPTRRTAVLTAIGVTGAAGALALAIAGNPALAEDPTPGPSSSAGASAPAPARPDRDAIRTQRRDELATALAAELGVDKAKVTAALDKIAAARQADHKADRLTNLKTRLDAAVAEGKLTAEQAAAILDAAEAGVLPRGGPGGHRGRPGR